MAPPFKRGPVNPDAWWEDSYLGKDNIDVQYELAFGRDIIRPGMQIRFKNDRGYYKFRCLAHNRELDVTWIDAVNALTGAMHSFHVARLKCLVKPKRSRRKKPID